MSISESGAENYDLVIQVGSSAEEIVATARLVEIVGRRLRADTQRGITPRRAKVFLANGDEQEFILDAED
jgi:hypothetical protein